MVHFQENQKKKNWNPLKRWARLGLIQILHIDWNQND